MSNAGDVRGGIDLGGTKIQAVVVDGDNVVLGQARHPTPTTGGPQDVGDAIGRGHDRGRRAGRRRGRGTVTSARNLPAWEGEFALGAALEQALGTRTRLRNDVQVANRRRGRARQSRRLGQGTGPPFVGKRIEELCRGKEAAEIDLRALTPGRVDSGPAEGAEKLLARLPDVGDAL